MAAPILGDIFYRAVSLWTRLAGNITTTKKFLTQTGTGTASAVPDWNTISATDLPNTAVTPATYGNATNVGQFTVDQQGRLTFAQNVAITAGSGDVVGPGSAVSDDFVMFNGTTGKIIKDNGLSLTTTVGTPGVDTLVPSEKAIRSAITAAGGGNVSTGVTLTSGQLIVGAGTTNIGVGNLSSDVTTSGSLVTTIANAVVTLAKIANAAANSKLLGSGSSGSGSPYSELTLGTGLSMSGTTLNASTTGGSEIAYVEFTSPVSITATTEATAQSVVSAGSVSFDGSTIVLIEFFTPFSQNSGSGAEIRYYLYEDGSSIGILGIYRNVAAVNGQVPTFIRRRMTPSNASHTYEIRASRVTANGTVGAGGGTIGVTMPGFIRIIRA